MGKSIVLKFGGASVANPENFLCISDIILKRAQIFENVVVVVSAMGNTTNELIDLAKKIHPNPPEREQDMLISVGERISISLLAMALELKGKKAISFTGSQSGIITCNKHTDAKIIDVKPSRILASLDLGHVVIVAGFQGVSKNKEITTLGRGGSDTSAVALAIGIGADIVEFYKDVKGIYSMDPKKNNSALFIQKMTHDEALKICQKGSKILSLRCVDLAKKNGCLLRVLSYKEALVSSDIDNLGTLIGSKKTKKTSLIYEDTSEIFSKDF
jgi:aspartate kinase